MFRKRGPSDLGAAVIVEGGFHDLSSSTARQGPASPGDLVQVNTAITHLHPAGVWRGAELLWAVHTLDNFALFCFTKK